MAKKKRYLKNKVISFICYGGVAGSLNLLMQANIEGIGRRIVRQDKHGDRYVIIGIRRHYFKKGHPVYDWGDILMEVKNLKINKH